MYADEKAPGEAKVGTPSLAGFVAWLETKDPEQAYNLYDATLCAYGQYYRSVGANPTPLFTCIARDLGLASETRAHQIAAGMTDDRSNWTFGHALTRARVALGR